MPRKPNPVCSGGCGRKRSVGPDFYLDTSGKPRQKCKSCTAVDNTRWRKENPETYRKWHRQANHRMNLKKRFGLTVEEYNVLVALSDGRCGICRKPESRDRRMCLDHDHKTGEVRGFLCSHCNLTLGNAGDSVEWLELAIQYLKSKEKVRTSDLDPPIPTILPCPMCGTKHVDKGKFATKRHHTHACQKCGLVWRPAIVATVGVEFLPDYKDPE